MDACWIIKDSFFVFFGAKLAWNQQYDFPTLSTLWAKYDFYGQKKPRKSLKLRTKMDEEKIYLTIDLRHFLLSCNPFWWSGNFLDTIGPSTSLCVNQLEGRKLYRPPYYLLPPEFSNLPTALSRTQALALKRPDRIEEWIQGLLPTPQVNTIIHLANFFHQHLI